MEEHEALRQRIWAHPLDHPGQALDIKRRLGLEQRWTPNEAEAAIEEYRRFCFLACVAGHPVTPSDKIDAVWHMHLLYTRDYWGVFCPKVLRKDFHHGPTEGGGNEERRFYDQYADTLASYAKFFGPPPSHWWPPAAWRFQPMNKWRWVYLPEYWLIPNPVAWVKNRLRSLPRILSSRRF